MPKQNDIKTNHTIGASYKQIQVKNDQKSTYKYSKPYNGLISPNNHLAKQANNSIKNLIRKKNGDCPNSTNLSDIQNLTCPIDIDSEIMSHDTQEKAGSDVLDIKRWEECENRLESLHATLDTLKTLAFYNQQHHTENFAKEYQQFGEKQTLDECIFEATGYEKLQEEINGLVNDKSTHMKFCAKYGGMKFRVNF